VLGKFALLFHFDLMTNVSASSGQPFNIAVGQDLNGDGQFNDRPSFATDLGRPSVVLTNWGAFDTYRLPARRAFLSTTARGLVKLLSVCT
jgi:hypothetical protein